MSKFALLNGGVVTNIFPDPAALAEAVHPLIAAEATELPGDDSGVDIGWRQVDGDWVAPMPPADDDYDEAPARVRVVDRQTLLAMIPAPVEFGIRAFAKLVVPPEDASYMARGTVGILLNRVDTASEINLDLPANIAGFQLLVTLGLMTQQQVDAVLAGPIT